MKFPKEDLPLIRTALALLASSLILGSAGIAGSIYLKELMLRGKNDDQNLLADTRTKLALVREEEQQIRLYHTKYLKLEEQGILAKENRLEWTEKLGQIRENRQIFEIDYQLDAQQAVQVDPALPQGSLALYGSTIKLGFSLLHEADLLNALEDIRKKNRGISLVRECTLSRIEKGAATTVSPWLKADCTVSWLSLRPKIGGTTP